MEFIIETPLSPHMACRATGLIARYFFFSSIRRVEPLGLMQSEKDQVLFPRANTSQSAPCRFVKVGHLEQAQSVGALPVQSKWTV